MKLYAIVDRKAKECINVFASINDDTAKRAFLSLLASPRTFFNDFFKDFSIYPCAEVSFKNGGLVISQHGNDALAQHGFKVNTFSEIEPLLMGVDCDQVELQRIFEARFPKASLSQEVEPDDTYDLGKEGDTI